MTLPPTNLPSSGSKDLTHLLTTLGPTLDPQTYVFATLPVLPDNHTAMDNLYQRALMSFAETHKGSKTFVLDEETAKDLTQQQHDAGKAALRTSDTEDESRQPFSGFQYEYLCRCITIDVHSSLAAIGFMPLLTGALAERGISCNPVSGFYSDHLFVPAARADDALSALLTLKQNARDSTIS